MDKKLAARILALVVLAGGLAVMAGWIVGIPALKSVRPDWVTMKFLTAIAFVFGGLLLFLRPEREKSAAYGILAPMCSFVILIIAASVLLSILLGIDTGIEQAFVKEAPGAIQSTAPGTPAVSTLAAFILIASVGIIDLHRDGASRAAITWIGALVAVIGGAAALGYLLGIPALYFNFADWSTSMAAHTAFFFFLLGASLLLGETND